MTLRQAQGKLWLEMTLRQAQGKLGLAMTRHWS
jgi:hypothetical protein